MRDVLGIEQFGGGRVFAQAVFRRWARVHEGLRHDRQAGVRDAAFVDVKHKLGILDHVYPEAQGEAAGTEITSLISTLERKNAMIDLLCQVLLCFPSAQSLTQFFQIDFDFFRNKTKIKMQKTTTCCFGRTVIEAFFYP